VHGPAEDSQERQQLADEMRIFGASDEDIAAALKGRKDLNEDFFVLDENWEALKWFLEVSDQFNYTQGVCVGANLVGVKADAEMSGRQYTPEQYDKLRKLMRFAVRELNARMESK
jgi:hypothetical protein